jgi:Flp pilus assembly protein protease CpaA
MFEIIGFLIALIGSTLAAIFDVKITPTEIPDEIPHGMIILAIFLAFLKSILNQSLNPFLESLFFGISLLAFGFLMYRFGQWGGGDAKILAAIGFFSPLISPLTKNILFPFAVSYLFNVFIIGAAYMLIYAFVLAILNKKIFSCFLDNVKSSSKMMLIFLSSLFLLFFIINFYLFHIFNLPINFYSLFSNSLVLLIFSLAFLLLWIFIKTVEKVAFQKKIPVSKLKVGDVLLESKVWEGITEKELRKIKASGKKFVWIKEGVRFAPAFPLALIFSIFFGDSIFLFLKFLV